MIELINVSYKYVGANDDLLALSEVSFTLDKGNYFVLLGANGSGKSTLAMVMAGILKPSEGRVILDGLNLDDTKLKESPNKKIAVLLQNPLEQLVSGSVESDIAFSLENYGVPPDVIRQRVDESMKLFDLYDVKGSHPRELSGGEQQKVAFAGIWALKPEYIICDEVTTFLDYESRKLLLNMLKKFSNDGGGVLLITQYPSEALNSDNLFIIENGKIVNNGKPSEILINEEALYKAGHYVPQNIELDKRLKDIIGAQL